MLKSVDYGRMAEILVQRAASPDEFTRLTAITWVSLLILMTIKRISLYFHIILVLVDLVCFGKHWLISVAIGYM